MTSLSVRFTFAFDVSVYADSEPPQVPVAALQHQRKLTITRCEFTFAKQT